MSDLIDLDPSKLNKGDKLYFTSRTGAFRTTAAMVNVLIKMYGNPLTFVEFGKSRDIVIVTNNSGVQTSIHIDYFDKIKKAQPD